MLLAIDPGPQLSAWVIYNGDLVEHDISPNEKLLERILWNSTKVDHVPEWMVIERMVSYGRPVGTATFETVYWTGVFCQAFGRERTTRMDRRPVKKHLCPSTADATQVRTIKDGNIRQALIDLWIDRTDNMKPHRKGGPLYRVSKDTWQALALGVTWWDTEREWISKKLPASMRVGL